MNQSDGSIETLEQVIGHYKAGARTIKKRKFAGVGSKNPLKSKVVSGFNLTVKEPRDRAEFPEKFNTSLIYQQPRFQNPEFTLVLTRQSATQSPTYSPLREYKNTALTIKMEVKS